MFGIFAFFNWFLEYQEILSIFCKCRKLPKVCGDFIYLIIYLSIIEKSYAAPSLKAIRKVAWIGNRVTKEPRCRCYTIHKLFFQMKVQARHQANGQVHGVKVFNGEVFNSEVFFGPHRVFVREDSAFGKEHGVLA